jgi:RimJ/RimL family protein N-acetyltransferase
MRLLTEHDAEVGKWLGDQMGVRFVEPFGAIGVLDDDGTLVGGWVLNSFNGYNGDLTIYGPGFMTRRTIRACFAHLFVDLKLTRVTARVRRDNIKHRETLPRIGFKLECVARRYYGPFKRDDAFVFVLFPDGAKRWLS